VPAFSHAPSGSHIATRNAKKALFYAAYLRRAQLDEPFLAAAFAMQRNQAANEPIVPPSTANTEEEQEAERKIKDGYAAYLATEVHCM
jgi:hypothetical protein